MPHQVFEKPIRIHFGDCDPAGIVYHPTYYVLLNKFHEDFLHEVLKVGFIEIRRFGVGFPVVGVHTDFVSPSRPGEEVTGRLWIEKLGTSSVKFAFTITHGEELRVRCVETMVCVRLDTEGNFVSSPIPEELRARMMPYVCEEGDERLSFRS